MGSRAWRCDRVCIIEDDIKQSKIDIKQSAEDNKDDEMTTILIMEILIN